VGFPVPTRRERILRWIKQKRLAALPKKGLGFTSPDQSNVRRVD
jgi:hypothetical protein